MTTEQVIAFVALGVILIAAIYVYYRMKKKNEPEPIPTPKPDPREEPWRQLIRDLQTAFNGTKDPEDRRKILKEFESEINKYLHIREFRMEYELILDL